MYVTPRNPSRSRLLAGPPSTPWQTSPIRNYLFEKGVKDLLSHCVTSFDGAAGDTFSCPASRQLESKRNTVTFFIDHIKSTTRNAWECRPSQAYGVVRTDRQDCPSQNLGKWHGHSLAALQSFVHHFTDRPWLAMASIGLHVLGRGCS